MKQLTAFFEGCRFFLSSIIDSAKRKQACFEPEQAGSHAALWMDSETIVVDFMPIR